MRLVLCDDNRILCEALAAVLESHGHRVVAIATCAADGIAAVSAYRPDACLLDLRLPDGDGLDTARTMGRSISAPGSATSRSRLTISLPSSFGVAPPTIEVLPPCGTMGACAWAHSRTT